jgi:hypothetical protein
VPQQVLEIDEITDLSPNRKHIVSQSRGGVIELLTAAPENSYSCAISLETMRGARPIPLLPPVMTATLPCCLMNAPSFRKLNYE